MPNPTTETEMLKLSEIKPEHQEMVEAIASTFGKEVRIERNEDFIDFEILLDGRNRRKLQFRGFGGNYRAPGWVCLLTHYGMCTAQSDGSGDAPCRATPQTAFDGMLEQLQEQITEKQEMLDQLKRPTHKGALETLYEVMQEGQAPPTPEELKAVEEEWK